MENRLSNKNLLDQYQLLGICKLLYNYTYDVHWSLPPPLYTVPILIYFTFSLTCRPSSLSKGEDTSFQEPLSLQPLKTERSQRPAPMCSSWTLLQPLPPSRGRIRVPFPWTWRGLSPHWPADGVAVTPRLSHKSRMTATWFSWNVHARTQPPCCEEASRQPDKFMGRHPGLCPLPQVSSHLAATYQLASPVREPQRKGLPASVALFQPPALGQRWATPTGPCPKLNKIEIVSV